MERITTMDCRGDSGTFPDKNYRLVHIYEYANKEKYVAEYWIDGICQMNVEDYTLEEAENRARKWVKEEL